MAGVAGVTIRRLPEHDSDDSLAFTVSEGLQDLTDLAGLDKAISEAHGFDKRVGLSVMGRIMWVHNTDVDARKVSKAVKAALDTKPEPEPAWKDKIRQNEDLSPDEMQQAIRALFAGRI